MGDRRYDESMHAVDRESQRGPLRSLDRGSREMSRDAPPGRIYVGNLPPNSDRKTLEDLFGRYGRIVDISVKRTISGTPFAFVEFGDARDAEDAIRERDSYKLDGCILRVEIPFAARGGRPGGQNTTFRGPPRRGEFRVAVRGLPPSGSWQDLKDHMREAGECVFADVFRDGTGVVEFARRADMEYALKNFQDSLFKSHEGETSHISVSRVQDDEDMDPMVGNDGRHLGGHRSQSPSRLYGGYGGGGSRGGSSNYYGGGGGGSSRNASSNPSSWSSREMGRGGDYGGSTRSNWHSGYGSSSGNRGGYDVDPGNGAAMDAPYSGGGGYYESSSRDHGRRESGSSYSRSGRSGGNYYRSDDVSSAGGRVGGSIHHHHHHSSSSSSNPHVSGYSAVPSRERRSPSYSGGGAGYGRSRSRSRSFATRYR